MVMMVRKGKRVFMMRSLAVMVQSGVGFRKVLKVVLFAGFEHLLYDKQQVGLVVGGWGGCIFRFLFLNSFDRQPWNRLSVLYLWTHIISF